MSRLSLETPNKAQTVVEGLYQDLERRIAASTPGLCPVDISLGFLRLCHAQTCGKCSPCRIGLGQLAQLMDDVLSERATLETIDLIEQIYRAAGQDYPELHLYCENLGAGQIIVERTVPVKEKYWLTVLKVGFASLIIFDGSAFTIMTYDQDVDVTGVFARIYQMVLGQVPEQPGVLEAGYALGVAAGILMFFNPFTASKKRKEPSPIEIEMEKYESDIRDTIVKMSGRERSES